jgi:hypothetical protein
LCIIIEYIVNYLEVDMKVRLDEGDCGTYLLTPIATNKEVKAMEFKNRKAMEDELGILVQTDWDYPGTASTFGWSPCTECEGDCKGITDGTVDCAQKSASAMISEAGEYLDEHIGDIADDPGYFGG